jgi:biotin carboxyl carrier protein
VAVYAAVGELVRTGQPLVTLEAMKMEHAHLAPCDGRVVALQAVVGASIAAGVMLADVQPSVAVDVIAEDGAAAE